MPRLSRSGKPVSEVNPLTIGRWVKLFQTGSVAGFERFCTECVKITGGDEARGTAIIPFRWWPAQKELARSLCSDSEVIVLKPRQMGASWLVLAWFLYRSMFWSAHEYRITSVGQEEAAKALRRIKFMIDHLPPWCKPTLEVENTTMVKFEETQSWISALPATSNAGRGDTLNGLLSDEAAFQVYAKEIIKSARPALEKRNGSLIVLSTANGVGNHFQEEFVKAERGQNGYKAHFFPWTADPHRDQKWYERNMRKHGPEYMHENYPATAAEAFLASGRPFFDQAKVTVDLEAVTDNYEEGFIDGRTFAQMDSGALRVWARPDPARRYVIGADVGEGLEHGDWSNAYVMDVQDKRVVARVRGKFDVGEYADLLMQVGDWYSLGEDAERMPALLAVEANNQGIAVVKRCEEGGYRNLWRDRDLRTGAVKERIGWLTTEITRRMMLGKLQTEYRMGRVAVPDRECLEEMALFAHRGPRGKCQAPPGKNDDAVLSLGIALYVAHYEAPVEEAQEVDEGMGARYWALQEERKMLKGEPGAEMNVGIVELGG